MSKIIGQINSAEAGLVGAALALFGVVCQASSARKADRLRMCSFIGHGRHEFQKIMRHLSPVTASR